MREKSKTELVAQRAMLLPCLRKSERQR